MADDFTEEWARSLLTELGWTLHRPGQSCIDGAHVYKGKQETSLAASIYVAPSVGTLRRRVLDALIIFGPMTDPEIQKLLGMSANSQRPRRKELLDGGFVRNSGQERKHNGRGHIVWEVVRDG